MRARWSVPPRPQTNDNRARWQPVRATCGASVEQDLQRRYSPEQIAGRLRREFPDDAEMRRPRRPAHRGSEMHDRKARASPPAADRRRARPNLGATAVCTTCRGLDSRRSISRRSVAPSTLVRPSCRPGSRGACVTVGAPSTASAYWPMAPSRVVMITRPLPALGQHRASSSAETTLSSTKSQCSSHTASHARARPARSTGESCATSIPRSAARSDRSATPQSSARTHATTS